MNIAVHGYEFKFQPPQNKLIIVFLVSCIERKLCSSITTLLDVCSNKPDVS